MFYKQLDIDDFEEIQNEISEYVIDYVFEHLRGEDQFYNFIFDDDLQKFKRDIPSIFEAIQRTLVSEVLTVDFVYVYKHSYIPIHSDDYPNVDRLIKLNWPILNGDSAATIFYEKKDPNNSGTFRALPNGASGYFYDISECNEICQYVLNRPTLMDAKQLHRVQIINDRLPRVLLSMKLSNEEEIFQKYFKGQ